MNLLTSRTNLPGSQEVVDEPVDDLWTTCGRPVDEPPGQPPGRFREPTQFDPVPDQPPDLLTSPPNGRSGQEVRFRVKPPGRPLRKFRNLVHPNFPPNQ